MHTAGLSNAQSDKYLLVPMMPTPNGPLHLGHIAGPYLKMDVLARALRQQGHRVALISTTDAFESHVLQSARKYSSSVFEICERFHNEIQRDFAYLDIRFDAFINPNQQPWADRFRAAHADLVTELMERSSAHVVTERHLCDASTGEAILGFELSGKCPSCATDTVGFVCENCGLQVTTEMLIEPGRTNETRPLVWSSGETIALRLHDLKQLLHNINDLKIPAAFKSAMITFLTDNNLVRLSTLDIHGVAKYRVGEAEFNLYNSYLGHALFCGSIYSELFSERKNPFERGSHVVTVTSCGLDNATDLASSMACASAHGNYKTFDFALGNFFLSLDGKKFSTSLGNAIFVSDLASCPSIATDAVRFYLADLSPHDGVKNFVVREFVDFYNGWFVDELGPTITKARELALNPAAGQASVELEHMVSDALQRRHEALSLNNFCPPIYTAAIQTYLANSKSFARHPGQAYFWLRAFARLASPLMPSLCARILSDIGIVTETHDPIANKPPPLDQPQPISFERISRDDFPSH